MRLKTRKTKVLLITSLFLFLFGCISSWGESSSFDSKSKPFQKNGSGKQIELSLENFVPKNKFIEHFVQIIMQSKSLPYEVRRWIFFILEEKFAQAHHQWSAIQPYMPAEFFPYAKTANLYTLWKLGLPQTFFNAWVEELASANFLSSPFTKSFHLVLERPFPEWWRKNFVIISESQRAVLNSIPLLHSPSIFSEVKATMALKHPVDARKIIPVLTETHPLRKKLIETVIVDYAQKKEPKNAIEVVEKYFVSTGKENADPDAFIESIFYLARLYFQLADLKKSESYYRKIPMSSPLFMKAQQEILWVLLRQNDLMRLRGGLANLGDVVLKDFVTQDYYIVRAISNLKLCYFSEVFKDFKQFSASQKKEARLLDLVFAQKTIPRPPERDFYIQRVEAALAQRRRELQLIRKFMEQSAVEASLPALGVQKHWVIAYKNLQNAISLANTNVQTEYQRYWENRKKLLKETIQKFKFVQVEYVKQLREFSQYAQQNKKRDFSEEETGETGSGEIPSLFVKQVVEGARDEKTIYPYDKVMWPDEVFKVGAEVESMCIKRRKL